MIIMKRITLVVAAALMACFLISCQSGDQSENTANGADAEMAPSTEQENPKASEEEAEEIRTEISKEQASKILASYLKIKDWLVKTDGVGAREEAKALVETIGKTEDELGKKLYFDAEHISETKDHAHQRDHFYTLSNNVYALVKATGANSTPLYRQFCPMARDNQGAFWLSAEAEVFNPYFGNEMLHCGSVKEEL